MIFEFTLVPSTAEQGKMAASEITMVYDYGAGRWTPPLNDREPRPAMVTAQQRFPRSSNPTVRRILKITKMKASPRRETLFAAAVADALPKLLG